MDISQRALAASGLIAPVVFTILTIVAGALTPGYSHAALFISNLGEVGAATAPLQNLAFILTGLLVIAFAVGFHRGMPGESRSGPAFVVVAGIGLAGTGIFQCDPGCSGALFQGSLRDSLHFVMFQTAVAGGILGALFTARRLSGYPRWRKIRSFSLLIGYLTLAIFIAWSITPLGVYLGDGTVERLIAGLPFLWVAVMGIRLLSPPSNR